MPVCNARAPSTVRRRPWLARLAAPLAVLVTLSSTSALAQQACYSRAEYDAEQALWLEAELTVVAFSCPTPAGATDLRIQYGEFRKRSGDVWRKWHGTALSHLKKAGLRGNDRQIFERFQSEISNRMGNRAATISPAAFCQTRMPHFLRVTQMSSRDLESYVTSPEIVRLSTKPLCQPIQLDLPEPEVVAATLRPTAQR